MQLLLMRHGHTQYNELHLCNDDPRVDVHLTAQGIAQAQAAAETLRDVRLDLILVTELPRTQQTAAIINQWHQAPIQVEPRFNDIRSGFEGQPVDAYFAAVGRDRFNIRPPGGESLRDFQARVLPALDELRRRQEQAVLVVTHEETLRVLAAHLRGLADCELESLQFGNCEIIAFDIDNPHG